MKNIRSIKVSLKIPLIGSIEGTWEPDETEQQASWEMYVELISRISIVELGPNEGSLREALSSLHILFITTRNILRKYGPSLARPKGKSDISFAYLAVAILNGVLRPTLAYWHPLLLDHENSKPNSVSSIEHEHRWAENARLRQELNDIRQELIIYANILAEVAQVPSLIF